MADAICCLPPGATLDDTIEKIEWLYGSVESFDTVMQEFYRIVQGKNEKVQTFVLHLERVLKAIKQQHLYAMTEEEGVRHLKDHLFHRLKPNLHNALHYMYDKLGSHHSQLVMASWKAETETPGSSVSEARAKSAVVGMGTASQVKGASSEPSYEALTQQIAYLMSTVTNQTNQNSSKSNGCNDYKSSNGNGKYSYTKFKKNTKGIEKIWNAGYVEVQEIAGENLPHPGKGIISLSSPTIKLRIKTMVKI